jgi:hypothetical protein
MDRRHQGREWFTASKKRRKKMTQYTNQLELEFLSEPELRSKLCQIFNTLPGLQQFSPECKAALASFEQIQKALRRKLQSPKP